MQELIDRIPEQYKKNYRPNDRENLAKYGEEILKSEAFRKFFEEIKPNICYVGASWNVDGVAPNSVTLYLFDDEGNGPALNRVEEQMQLHGWKAAGEIEWGSKPFTNENSNVQMRLSYHSGVLFCRYE